MAAQCLQLSFGKREEVTVLSRVLSLHQAVNLTPLSIGSSLSAFLLLLLFPGTWAWSSEERWRSCCWCHFSCSWDPGPFKGIWRKDGEEPAATPVTPLCCKAREAFQHVLLSLMTEGKSGSFFVIVNGTITTSSGDNPVPAGRDHTRVSVYSKLSRMNHHRVLCSQLSWMFGLS